MYPQAEQAQADRPYRDARTAAPATLSLPRLQQQLNELDKILSRSSAIGLATDESPSSGPPHLSTALVVN